MPIVAPPGHSLYGPYADGSYAVVAADGTITGYLNANGDPISQPSGSPSGNIGNNSTGGPPPAPSGPGSSPPSSSAPSNAPYDPNADPYYQQLKSLYGAQSQSEQASFRSSIQQMLIGLGLIPQNFTDKFGAMDETTKALIQKNTDTGISSYARLVEGRNTGLRDIIAQLTSRGMRRSGSRGYKLNLNQLGFDRNLADTLSAFLRDVGGLYSGFTNNEYARQSGLINAAMQGSNYFNMGGGGGGTRPPPAGPTPPGGSSSRYPYVPGTPSYDNPQGGYWDFGNGVKGY